MAGELAVHRRMRLIKKQLVAASLLASLLALPIVADAAMSAAANAMCNPWFAQCACDQVPDGRGGCTGGKNTNLCPPGVCFDTPPNGKVDGICITTNKCEGTGTEKGGIGDMQSMMDILKSVMDALKKKEDGGGSGEQPTPQDQTGCKQSVQVSAPSSDPCANYVPPVSNMLFSGDASGTESGASTELLKALNVGINAAFGVDSPADTTSNANVTSVTSTPSTSGQSLPGQAVDVGTQSPPEGTYGGIVTTDTGGTIYAGSRDVGQNVEVAGFFGAGSFVGKIQSAAEDMCKARPWAGSLVARLIPETFFDGLCSWRGYQVGSPAPQPSPTPQVATKSSTSMTSPTVPQTAATSTPSVDIWAVPESVSLGFRASIFWNTKNVDSCTVNSSGSNFNETKLSGGASTVPLTSDTTFTISCSTLDGATRTDQVTVTISP